MKFLSILLALMEMRDKGDEQESLGVEENRVCRVVLVRGNFYYVGRRTFRLLSFRVNFSNS